jgi:hypothetical protein
MMPKSASSTPVIAPDLARMLSPAYTVCILEFSVITVVTYETAMPITENTRSDINACPVEFCLFFIVKLMKE